MINRHSVLGTLGEHKGAEQLAECKSTEEVELPLKNNICKQNR